MHFTDETAMTAHQLKDPEIPNDEIIFHTHSFGDPGGRLFTWRGELYRAISGPQASFVRNLFRTGIVERLVDRGLLIESEITPYQLNGYAMVVHHRTVP